MVNTRDSCVCRIQQVKWHLGCFTTGHLDRAYELFHHLDGFEGTVARIIIEDFDASRHGNPMWYIDDAQGERYQRAPTIVRYKVCLVNVCGFTFIFHSLAQLRLCLEYYSQERQPLTRLPVHRWFEKLPLYLLEKPKRAKVVAALKRALEEYFLVPEPETGTPQKPLYGI